MQPQAVGDGRVNFQGFGGDAAALFRRHRLHGVHVVQAVGQFDQDHPHILRHRQQHFAEVFRLRLVLRIQTQLVELGYAIDQHGHRLAERARSRLLVAGGVFHHVVQQRGDQGLRVKMPFGEDAGDRQRMGD